MIKEKLRLLEIFSKLDDKDLNKIADITKMKTLNKGNIVFYEGDDSDFFHVLLDGHLKLYKTGTKSNEIVLHFFTTPTLVAEMATLENIKFPATSVAMRDNTLVAFIDKEKFITILKEDCDFSFNIVKSLTKKIKNLEVAINRNLIFDATSKVCSFIKEDPSFLMSHKNVEVANILNMAPETFSRVLTKLKSIEIIDKDNQLIDEDKLDMFLDF